MSILQIKPQSVRLSVTLRFNINLIKLNHSGGRPLCMVSQMYSLCADFKLIAIIINMIYGCELSAGSSGSFFIAKIEKCIQK